MSYQYGLTHLGVTAGPSETCRWRRFLFPGGLISSSFELSKNLTASPPRHSEFAVGSCRIVLDIPPSRDSLGAVVDTLAVDLFHPLRFSRIR